MDEPDLSVFTTAERSAWLRMRTLILLRWLAVAGQSAAVLAAWLWLGLDLPLAACAGAIAVAALFNLAAMRATPQDRRLSERDAALTLLFDLCQLALLLFLTGGLANPFALLMLVPVTISASVLSLRATLLLGAAATALISALVLFNVPLRLFSGVELTQPTVLTLGAWVSLVTGNLFLGIYARRVSGETFLMSQALTATQLALDREQRFTALGAEMAAAAHELGTPLATIRLASSELADELADRPELLEDALLIRAQTDRCRDILRTMGARRRDDAHPPVAPLATLVAEAAAPHAHRGRRLVTRIGAANGDGSRAQPEIPRSPEIIQGLRNLVQNAVDFARATVWIDIDWTEDAMSVAIGDDGPGYPPELVARIGEPFLRRRGPQPERPGYEGMGLGLFISKTLLERSGARVSFGNAAKPPSGFPAGQRPTGAVVTVTWPRAAATRSEHVEGARRGNEPSLDD